MIEKQLKSKWYKFSDYEVIGDTIVPTKDAKLIMYDPIAESQKLKNKKSAPIYKDILDIYDIKDIRESDNAWLKFAKKWGLPGNLLNEIDEIILHPQYLPFDNYQMKEAIKDHYTPWENKKVVYEVHNFSYHFKKAERTIKRATEKNKKNLGKYYSIRMNFFSHALNKNDPNDLTWPPSNKVHLCPQQIIYKYRNGKWEFTTHFFQVKKLNKQAKTGDIIPKENIKGKYFEPGYYILSNNSKTEGEIINIEIEKEDSPKRVFIPFYEGKIFYKFDNKKIVGLIEADKEFTDRFPRITEILGDTHSDKEYAENKERYMWPFPGNENFHKNFGEDLISLHKYAGDIWTIFKTLKDSNKMSKEFASLSKKELSKEQYSILFSTTEKLLRKYTSKITHTFALSKNKEYILHSPSLSGYIGQIILQDITSSFSPRYCLNLKCGRPIFNPSRIDQQWCNDICGNAQRVANWRKIKKLKALLKNKKISKKEHDKQLYLIENNIIFE